MAQLPSALACQASRPSRSGVPDALDGEVDDGGGAAPGGGPGAGLEGVGGEGAAERQLHVGVGVDAARDDVLARWRR